MKFRWWDSLRQWYSLRNESCASYRQNAHGRFTILACQNLDNGLDAYSDTGSFCLGVEESHSSSWLTAFGTNRRRPWITWLILLFCLFAAMFLAWRDEHRKAKNLKERLTPRLQVTVEKKSIANAIWNGNKWMIFLRVIVSSLTERRIQNAKAYLVSIEKDSEVLWDNEEVPLTFAPGEGSDALCKTIEHGGSYPVDVVIVERGEDALFQKKKKRDWPHFDSLRDIFSKNGEYIINVRVSADDCPSILAKVKFHWGGSSFDCGIDVIATQVVGQSKAINSSKLQT